MAGRRPRRDPETRFHKRYIVDEATGCWNFQPAWGKPAKPRWYPAFFLPERTPNRILASHYSLELAGRPLPKGLFACHSCDNPNCVNPDHLFHGTHKDNLTDAAAKGRMWRGQKGRPVGLKLSEETKAKIGASQRARLARKPEIS